MTNVLYFSVPLLGAVLLFERRVQRSRIIAALRVAVLWMIAVVGCSIAFESHYPATPSFLVVIAALWFFPAAIWAYATNRSKCLAFRATMHAIANTGVLLVVLPHGVFSQFGGSWRVLLDQSNWKISMWLHLIALPAVVGISAIQEFYRRGGGTPDPLDGPVRLVRSGIYSYIANPMEGAALLVIVATGIVVHSLALLVIAIVITIYFLSGSDRAEEKRLATLLGDEWARYSIEVRTWHFRWRPFVDGTATLYVAQSCGMCSELGRWLTRRKPVGLRFAAAEEHPTGNLTRITYEPGDGSREEIGVAALARVLEHINFAWAFVGFIIRLPLLRQLIQVMVDASGGEARRVLRCEANVDHMSYLGNLN